MHAQHDHQWKQTQTQQTDILQHNESIKSKLKACSNMISFSVSTAGIKPQTAAVKTRCKNRWNGAHTTGVQTESNTAQYAAKPSKQNRIQSGAHNIQMNAHSTQHRNQCEQEMPGMKTLRTTVKAITHERALKLMNSKATQSKQNNILCDSRIMQCSSRGTRTCQAFNLCNEVRLLAFLLRGLELICVEYRVWGD